jgi:hypothetical protein
VEIQVNGIPTNLGFEKVGDHSTTSAMSNIVDPISVPNLMTRSRPMCGLLKGEVKHGWTPLECSRWIVPTSSQEYSGRKTDGRGIVLLLFLVLLQLCFFLTFQQTSHDHLSNNKNEKKENAP